LLVACPETSIGRLRLDKKTPCTVIYSSIQGVKTEWTKASATKNNILNTPISNNRINRRKQAISSPYHIARET
jgi:hypothetical protein